MVCPVLNSLANLNPPLELMDVVFVSLCYCIGAVIACDRPQAFSDRNVLLAAS